MPGLLSTDSSETSFAANFAAENRNSIFGRVTSLHPGRGGEITYQESAYQRFFLSQEISSPSGFWARFHQLTLKIQKKKMCTSEVQLLTWCLWGLEFPQYAFKNLPMCGYNPHIFV